MCFRILLVTGLISFVVGCAEDQVTKSVSVESKSITATSFNTAGAPTVEFSAPDMMCPEGCGAKVKEVLSGQPGAKEVIVDFETKTAKVAVEKDGKFDANAAIAALVDHGFKNSAIKGDAANSVAKP